jgi:hypothetical protein
VANSYLSVGLSAVQNLLSPFLGDNMG